MVGNFLEVVRMETADFHEVYAAMVDCPYCGESNELDLGGSRYCEGEEVTCCKCGLTFKLGESL